MAASTLEMKLLSDDSDRHQHGPVDELLVNESPRFEAGGHRLRHRLLNTPVVREGSEFVRLYSLAELKDSDFWRALLSGSDQARSSVWSNEFGLLG